MSVLRFMAAWYIYIFVILKPLLTIYLQNILHSRFLRGFLVFFLWDPCCSSFLDFCVVFVFVLACSQCCLCLLRLSLFLTCSQCCLCLLSLSPVLSSGVRFVQFVPLFVLTFLVPCCGARYHFHIETMFGSSLPPLFVGGSCLNCPIVFLCVLSSMLWCPLRFPH